MIGAQFDIAVVVVFFNPTLENYQFFAKLSKSYKVYAWWNSDIIDGSNSEFINLGNGVNKGLSASYNAILDNVLEDWLIIFDQDSVFEYNLISSLSQAACETTETVAAFAPTVISNGFSYPGFRSAFWGLDWCISSGMLLNREIVKDIGGFAKDYFIDRIDFELCFRLKKNGFIIKIVDHAKLNQVFGDGSIRKNYSDFRLFHQVKNTLLFGLRDASEPFKGLIFVIAMTVRQLGLTFIQRRSPKPIFKAVLAVIKTLRNNNGNNEP
jgi:rhamnosyltransferase